MNSQFHIGIEQHKSVITFDREVNLDDPKKILQEINKLQRQGKTLAELMEFVLQSSTYQKAFFCNEPKIKEVVAIWNFLLTPPQKEKLSCWEKIQFQDGKQLDWSLVARTYPPYLQFELLKIYYQTDPAQNVILNMWEFLLAEENKDYLATWEHRTNQPLLRSDWLQILMSFPREIRIGALQILVDLFRTRFISSSNATGKAAIPFLIQGICLSDDYGYLRKHSLFILTGLFRGNPEGGKEHLSSLIPLLKAPSPYGAINAAILLGTLKIHAKEAVPAMIEALAEKKGIGRGRIALALGEIGVQAKAGIPQLICCLKEENEEMQRAASFALGEMGEEAYAAISVLKEKLDHENASIRQAAIESLRKLTGEEN